MRYGERGSTMIEAALILSVLMSLLIGMAEAGRRLMAWNFVSYAAREGTRFAAVRGAGSKQPATPQDIETCVKGFAMGVDPAAVHVQTEWLPDNQPGSRVRVEVAVGDSLKSVSEVTVLR